MSKGRQAAFDRIKHMVEATDSISRYAAAGREHFDTNPQVCDAILYQITVLGEAAKAALVADSELATIAPEVEWSLIARMRDRVIHHYWRTDDDIVWSTATQSVPQLRTQLTAVLARLRL